MSSRWYAVGTVYIMSSVSGSCLAALCLGWCYVSVGLCTVLGSGERGTRVDYCSLLAGRFAYSNFLSFTSSSVFWGLGCLIGFFVMLLFIDLRYLTNHCFDSSVQYCLILVLV